MKRKAILVFSVLALVSCGVNSNLDSNGKSGEILIDLKEGVATSDFSAKLKKYKLKENKVVSPSLNIVLFDFDQRKIGVDELIEKVKKMDEVENAQTNKEINNRN